MPTLTIRLIIAAAALTLASPALAQDQCGQLSAQLQAIDRVSPGSPGRAAQYQDAIDRQSMELSRTRDYAQSIGCDIDPSGDQQCAALATNLRRMQRNLSNLEEQFARISDDAQGRRQGERERLVAMLDENGCNGASAAQRPARSAGLFEQLFGGDEATDTYELPPSAREQSSSLEAPADPTGGATNLRTICVRKCDGFFFPISFSTNATSFPSDEAACRQRCPAADVELYAYNTFTEQPDNAISATSGRPLSDLPNAFRFRTRFDASCSCKPAGQTWAQALGAGNDATSPAEEALKRLDDADLSAAPTAAKPKPGRKAIPASVEPPMATGPASIGPAIVEGKTVETTSADGTKKKLRVVGPDFTPTP